MKWETRLLGCCSFEKSKGIERSRKEHKGTETKEKLKDVSREAKYGNEIR